MTRGGQHRERHSRIRGETHRPRDVDALAEHEERRAHQPRMERRPIHLTVRVVREREQVAASNIAGDRDAIERMRPFIPAHS
jgi:hypothetical protein